MINDIEESYQSLPRELQFAIVLTSCIIAIVVSIIVTVYWTGGDNPSPSPTPAAVCKYGVAKVIPSTDQDPLTVVCTNGNVYQP